MATSPTQEVKADILAIETSPNHLANDDVDVLELKRNALQAGEEVQLKSELDELSTWQVIVRLRKTIFIAAISGFTAATDGQCRGYRGFGLGADV